MQPEFIGDGPAVLIERQIRCLAIADPHFGVEADLSRHGLHFQSQTYERLKRLLSIIDDTKPDYLIVLGDLKHMIPYVTYQEKCEIPKVLSEIRKRTEFRIAPGNHDVSLERFLKLKELLPVSGALIDNTGYFHGHTIPSKDLFGKLILCGHHHPVVNIYDMIGCSLKGTPGYLLSEIDTAEWGGDDTNSSTRVLLVPAFNELAGGMDVRLIPGNKISPIAKAIKKETAEIFLKDGTYISSFEELPPDPREELR